MEEAGGSHQETPVGWEEEMTSLMRGDRGRRQRFNEGLFFYIVFEFLCFLFDRTLESNMEMQGKREGMTRGIGPRAEIEPRPLR